MTDKRLADIRAWQQSARMPGITCPGDPITPAQPWVARGADYVDELLGELEAIRAAGDALAEATTRLVREIDRHGVYYVHQGDTRGDYPHVMTAAALAAWAAARGDSGNAGEDGGETTQPAPQAPPDEPTIRAAVRAYILAEFLPGEDPAELKDDTPLVTGGILDEDDVLRLACFLDDRFGVFPVRGARDARCYDSVAAIARMVRERLAVPREGGPPP